MSDYNAALRNTIACSIAGLIVIALLGMSLAGRYEKLTNQTIEVPND